MRARSLLVPLFATMACSSTSEAPVEAIDAMVVVDDTAITDSVVVPASDTGDTSPTPDVAGGCPPLPVDPPGFHVAPTGNATNDGSKSKPWDLASVLAQPAAIVPGTTIWVHGGTYAGTFTSKLRGTADKPILLRAAAGERPILDAGTNGNATLVIGGGHTWYWGLEIVHAVTARDAASYMTVPMGDGIITAQVGGAGGEGVKMINLIVHDNSQGIGFWKDATDAEIYGSIIFDNGRDGPDRGHGHAIYSQNEKGNKRITDNLLFQHFSYGLHAYGSTAARYDGFIVEGNVSFSNGILSKVSDYTTDFLVGGEGPSKDNKVIGNYAWFPAGEGTGLNLGYGGGCTNSEARDNYFAAGTALRMKCSPVTISGNTFIGALSGLAATDFPGNTFVTTAPTTGVKIVIRANRYECGRAHVAIYDWDKRPEVEVDLGAAGLRAGDAYELHNAQDLFGDVITGTYDGKSAKVPMTGRKVRTPVGWTAPPTTFPMFGAFLLTRKGG